MKPRDYQIEQANIGYKTPTGFKDYEVNEEGSEFWSKARYNSAGKYLKRRRMKLILNNHTDYILVNFRREGKHGLVSLHRMVALAWVDGWFPGAQVNHKDKNKLNNHASNLEWITGAENITHGKSKEVHQYSVKGAYLNTFTSCLEASKIVGVRKAGISACATGKYKTSGGFKWQYSS